MKVTRPLHLEKKSSLCQPRSAGQKIGSPQEMNRQSHHLQKRENAMKAGRLFSRRHGTWSLPLAEDDRHMNVDDDFCVRDVANPTVVRISCTPSASGLLPDGLVRNRAIEGSSRRPSDSREIEHQVSAQSCKYTCSNRENNVRSTFGITSVSRPGLEREEEKLLWGRELVVPGDLRTFCGGQLSPRKP